MTKIPKYQALDNPQRLAALKRSALLDSPVEAAFDRLTALASQILNAPVSLVSLVETERQFFKSMHGLGEPWASQRETPIQYSFCQHVVTRGEPLVINDARENDLVKDNPSITELNVISYLGIPLTSADGWHLGSFCVIDNKPREWSGQEVETMKALAASVTTEIHLRMMIQEQEAIREQLEEQNKALEAFAHTVSHNLKNPLSTIKGWAGIARMYADSTPTEELLGMMEMIEDVANDAAGIIDELLLLAKVKQLDDVPRAEINMRDVIDDALLRVDLMLKDRSVRITLPDNLPCAVGHRPWIEEVWINYITNAIKYGGDPLEITFGGEVIEGSQVRFWIHDNGKGMTQEEVNKLFVPFNRLPSARQHEGHGLGLSIVQGITEKLGGQVGVESTPGEGSTFSFTLPLRC